MQKRAGRLAVFGRREGSRKKAVGCPALTEFPRIWNIPEHYHRLPGMPAGCIRWAGVRIGCVKNSWHPNAAGN